MRPKRPKTFKVNKMKWRRVKAEVIKTRPKTTPRTSKKEEISHQGPIKVIKSSKDQEMAKRRSSGKVNVLDQKVNGRWSWTAGRPSGREARTAGRFSCTAGRRRTGQRTGEKVNGEACTAGRDTDVPREGKSRTAGQAFTYRGSSLHVPRVRFLCTAGKVNGQSKKSTIFKSSQMLILIKWDVM